MAAKLKWMKNRKRVIETCAEVMVEAKIPEDYAREEAEAMWDICGKFYIRYEWAGAPSPDDAGKATERVKKRFINDLLKAVGGRLPAEWMDEE